ncbi:MAG: DedA family protein [Myxococcaceae bacterium]|nr:DedA family protein [Myxococcaceae bacterium]
MEQHLINLLDGASGPVAYGLVFGILLLCGLGLPIPEDVSLILGGFLVYEGRAELALMMVTGYVGIIVGDSVMFFLGRRIGARVTSNPFFSRLFTAERRARVEGLFQKHGDKVVMIARFLPGVRAVTYFTAGSARMKYRRFVFFDSVAALVSAPVFIYLGYAFGGELEKLINAVRTGQIRVLSAVVAVVVTYLVARRLWAKWRASKNPPRGQADFSPPARSN